MSDGIIVTSGRSAREGGTQTVTIPSAIAISLPPRCRWEVTVLEEGLFYRFLGEASEVTKRKQTIEVPFGKKETT